MITLCYMQIFAKTTGSIWISQKIIHIYVIEACGEKRSTRHSKVGIYVKQQFFAPFNLPFPFFQNFCPLFDFLFLRKSRFCFYKTTRLRVWKKSCISHNSKRKVAFLHIFFYIKYTNTKNRDAERYENLNYLKKPAAGLMPLGPCLKDAPQVSANVIDGTLSFWQSSYEIFTWKHQTFINKN